MTTRKRRGPPPTGKGELIGVRLLPEPLAALDAWITKQREPMSRPEAIRRLLGAAFGSAKSGQPYSRKTAAEATAAATREIARMADPSATTEQRKHRTRRLLEGPEEFRAMRKQTKRTKR